MNRKNVQEDGELQKSISDDYVTLTVPTRRSAAITALLTERDYHLRNCKINEWEHKDVPSVGDELTMMSVYLNEANVAFTKNSGSDAALDVIRKIGGMCMRAMENHKAIMREQD